MLSKSASDDAACTSRTTRPSRLAIAASSARPAAAGSSPEGIRMSRAASPVGTPILTYPHASVLSTSTCVRAKGEGQGEGSRQRSRDV